MAIPSVITGNWQYPDGSPVVGTLYLRLSEDAVVAYTGDIAPRVVRVILENGQIPLNFSIYANDELSPAGTTYDLSVVVGGGTVWSANDWSIAGPSPINLNTLIWVFELEDGTGSILLEDGTYLLVE